MAGRLNVGDLTFNVRANTSQLGTDLLKANGLVKGFTQPKGATLADELTKIRNSSANLANELQRAKGTVNSLAAMKPWQPIAPAWLDGWTAQINQAKESIGGGNGLMGMFSRFGAAVGVLGTALAGLNVSRWAVGLAADLQSTTTTFSVLTGSGQVAGKMLNELRTLASQSGVGFGSLQDAAKTMLSFGVATEQVVPALRAIATVTGGSAERTRMLSLAFSQMSAAGRLMGQDLLQMVNAGFNPLQFISKKTGESLIDLKKRMEDGGIAAQEVIQAFSDATSKGGKFFGLMEKQGNSFNMQWSKFTTQITLLGTELGNALLPPLTAAIKGANNFLAWFDKIRGAASKQEAGMRSLADTIDKNVAIEAKRTEELTKQTKLIDEQNSKLKDRAKSLTESLRSPLEKAADDFKELQGLINKGLISPETFERGSQKLLDELDRAVNKSERVKQNLNFDMVAADVRFSSGQDVGNRYRDNMEKLAKASVDSGKKQEELLKMILDEAKKRDDKIRINTVTIP